MRTVGLIVEGSFDEAALPELVKRCSHVETTVIVRPCGNKGRLLEKFRGYLEEFRYKGHVDKAFVVCDADQKNPREEIRRMRSRVSNRQYPFPVKYLVIVQKLEAWLLANEMNAPETVVDPKAELKVRLAKKKTDYTQEVARRLAGQLNLDTLRGRCPSFRDFPDAVVNGQASSVAER